MKLTSSVQSEYWFHVANQTEIPIAGEVDKSIDLELLAEVAYNTPPEEGHFLGFIEGLIQSNPDSIDMLRTLIGVSDKRMYLELSYAYSKAKYNKEDKTNILGYSVYDLNKKPLKFFKGTLKNSDKKLAQKSADIITKYLSDRQLHSVLSAIKKVEKDELKVLVDKLILTKEVQQAEAKRRGHGAEHALSFLVHQLGLKMFPDGRHSRAIGFIDPNVDRESFEISKKTKGRTWSFDLVIQGNSEENIAFVQSLIHTSDPGQYGVNKSDETLLIRQDLDTHNKRNGASKELWGIVDGVGFCENKKDTIDKMLDEFDCFVQMKSLYKAALRLHQKGLAKIQAIAFDTDFYDENEITEMFSKYGSKDIQNVSYDEPDPAWRMIEAGKARLFL